MFPSDALKDIWSRLLEAFSGDSCGGSFWPCLFIVPVRIEAAVRTPAFFFSTQRFASPIPSRLARQVSDFRSQIFRIDSGNLQGRAGVGLFFSPFCR